MTIVERLNEVAQKITLVHKGAYLNKISCLSDYDYLFVFSRNKNENILISLNVKNPFIKLTNNKYQFNESNSFYNKLKIKLTNACLINCSVLNEDNIICLEFFKTTDTYDKIHYFLIFEIFKSNSNLILLEENKVSEAFRYKGIETHHPIIKGANYTFPTKVGSDKEVQEKDIKNEDSYLLNINQNHINQKFKDISVGLKRKLKSLNKKIENIYEEREKANQNLRYKDYADYLLINLDQIKRGDSYLNYYDEKIKLNETYSPTDNLQRFYKIYKKAKLTISSTDDQIKKTNDEIDYISSILSSIDTYNEDDYNDLIKELLDKNLIKIPGKFKQKNLKNAAKPYYFFFNNIKIGFGKTAIQNSNLTFKYANKDSWFAHIKNAHGSHIIIFEPTPTDETIEFALGLVIFLAKKQDGEVQFAQVKSLKKGDVPGLVLLNKYESYQIKNLKYNYKSYIDSAKKF